jgi:hypothetical protein
MSDLTVPPMPWALRPAGICLAAAYLVPIKRVRPHIPASLPIVSVLPGLTIGALFLAEYGPGSDLEYNELIVVTGAVRVDGRIAWHVDEILVDNEASYRAGREMLGVPKHMAEFERAPDCVRIIRDGRPYLTWRHGRPWWLFHGRVHLEAVNADIEGGSRLRLCGNEIEAVVGLVSSEIDIAQGEAAKAFPSKPLISIAGKSAKAVLGTTIN